MGELIVDRDGGVLVLTLNRPEKRNAINGVLARQIADALDRLDDNDELRVGVITGAGGNFCSGMDLRGLLEGDNPRVPGRGFGGMVQRGSVKPLIAAVEGFALAGGFEMALACDIIVAGVGATFGLPEVKRGLTPAGGGALRLPRQIPHHVAMELLYTGDFIDADRAYELGLVSQRVDAGGALDAALETARKIAANAPLSVLAIKAIVTQAADWPTSEAFDRQEPITAPVSASEDAREGARAFTEKRAPVWSGR